MATGTVKFYSDVKGYGVITQDDGSFIKVRYRSISGLGPVLKSLAEGQKVEYIVADGENGPEAYDVTVI